VASTPGCSTRLSSRSYRVGPAGVEPAFSRLSDGCLSARSPAHHPAPCTGIEPVSPVRQTGWHASFITGHFPSAFQLSARPVGFEPTRPVLETGCSPRSTTLSSTILSSTILSSTILSAEGTGVEPASPFGSTALQAVAVAGCRLAPPFEIRNSNLEIRTSSLRNSRFGFAFLPASCPGRTRTFNRPVNSRPLYR
jgi:hypothetical protein